MLHPETVKLSKHAKTRCQEREISRLQIALAVDFGQRVNGTGVEICFLGRRDIPEWLDRRYAERVEGTVVILGHAGEAVTTYRNRDAMRELRKRKKLPRDPRTHVRSR